ncbi:hypothetical protein F5Y03DRAFT_97760 [Xylaria venustula]|nr:hypothetical protein F5Y03DRAFT_97760 [Xylaria venustula]
MMVTRRRASSRRGKTIMRSRGYLQPFVSMQLAILLLGFAAPVFSTPISYFPLNSQLPPAARVAEPFSFSFSPLTFSSDEEMSYALGDGSPPWLSLDSASRTLSGTPDDATIPPGETLTGVVISLIASDGTGSIAVNATLVVSRGAEPVVRIPLLEQIKKFGPYSAPDSVLLRPASEFEFEFDPNTFGAGVARSGSGQSKAYNGRRKNQDVKKAADGEMSGTEPLQLSYYAVSGNNAPLPSWVAFDPEKLAFSGKTPLSELLAQPPQKFDLKLVASDVVGFSAASIGFSIMVGNHELTSEDPIIKINATRGKKLEYTGLSKILKLDGQPLKADNISAVEAEELPGWLTFDEESWEISGTPDPEAQPTNITIVVVDKFSDDLNVTLAVDFDNRIFISNLPGLNVSAGDDISLDLNKFIFNPDDTQLTAKIMPEDSWIQFDDSSKILSGTVPKPFNAKLADDVRISFSATQKLTNEKETKDINIHVNRPVETDDPSSPQPTKGPAKNPSKDDDSRRDLYWLLIIPVMLVAVVIILSVFMVRKRRHQPRRLDFSEVSGPVPGTFVANGYMDPSLDEIRKMVDTGPQAPYVGPYPITPSNRKTLQATPNPKIEVDHITPHAMSRYSGANKPAQQGNHIRDSWLGGQHTRTSPTGTDEVSLLSNSSRGRGTNSNENLYVKKKRPGEKMQEKKIGLEVPETAEPLSIQPTPDLAYAVTGRYDYVSDEEIQPVIGSVEQRRSGHQQGHHGAQNRLSKAWKRMSASRMGDTKRNSQNSASTDETTCTSILTSGVTEEATTASANVVARPTIIHIPGRPGEARQLSRRTGGSTTFFAGGSFTHSQRNFGLNKDAASVSVYSPVKDPEHPVTSRERELAQDCDKTWDHSDTTPLGIAYQDPKRRTRDGNWNTGVTSQELMSPDRWPKPGVTPSPVGRGGVFRGQIEPLQLPPFKLPAETESPVTPTEKGKKRSSPMRRLSRLRGSISSLTQIQTPSTHTRSKGRSSREERLRLSRLREQKALDGFRAMMSHSPSPHNERPQPSVRPLPETPSRTSRPPLADQSNEPRGLRGVVSKRSVKTLRSNKSVRSARADDDDDDDAWEDIPPPESVIYGWEADGSDGSFPVYI